MIEPTETETKEELDLFVDAMRSIAAEIEHDPELVKTLPTRRGPNALMRPQRPDVQLCVG